MYNQQNRQNSVNRRRQFFKNSMRREQIDIYLNQSRKKLIESRSLDYNEISLQQCLKTQSGKIQYLTNKVKILNQKSINNWQKYIIELSSSLKYFSGRFNLWIECQLIQKLSQAFSIEYRDCQIHHIISKLFSNMIEFTSPKQCLSNAYIIDSFIVQNIIKLVKSTNYPPHQKIEFIVLFASLCSLSALIRNRILEIGGGQILVEFGNYILLPQNYDEQIISLYTYSCCQFLKNFYYNNKSYFPTPNFTISIIPNILKILRLRIDQKITKQTVICLLNMIKQTKNTIYNTILEEDQHFYQLLLKIAQTDPYKTKEQVFNIFTWVAYYYPELSLRKLWSLKLFDLINNDLSTTSPLSFSIISINLISNMVTNSQQALYFANHPLFQKILAFLKLPEEKIKQSTLDCIIIICDLLSYSEINNLITKNRILPRIIAEISNLKNNSISIILNALVLLQKYIISNKREDTDFNVALYYLQKHYDFEKTLMNIFSNSSLQGLTGQKVRSLSGRIIDFMSDCVYDDPL